MATVTVPWPWPVAETGPLVAVAVPVAVVEEPDCGFWAATEVGATSFEGADWGPVPAWFVAETVNV